MIGARARPLPIRETVKRAYAIFVEAPIAFLVFATVPFIVTAILFVFVDLSLDHITENFDAWRPFFFASSFAAYAILIFCIGVMTAGAAHLLRGHGFSVARTMSATLRRLPSMLLASIHVALTLGILFYGIAIPFAGIMPFGLFLALAVLDTTVLAFVFSASRVEGRGPLSSVARSERVSRGNLARLFASFFIAMLPISVGSVLLGRLTSATLGPLAALFGTALDVAALSIVSAVAFETLAPSAASSGAIDPEILRVLE